MRVGLAGDGPAGEQAGHRQGRRAQRHRVLAQRRLGLEAALDQYEIALREAAG